MEFTENHLQIQFEFKDAIFISTGETKDKLQVKLNNPWQFTDERLGRPILERYYTMELVSQMPAGDGA
jgi:hypothetical protein